MKKIFKLLFVLIVVFSAINIQAPKDASATAGYVTISGQVTYQPRNWDPLHPTWLTGSEMQIELYEKDLQNNSHLLATTTTNTSGSFSFPSRLNWWGPDNRQLNVYYVITTAYPSSTNAKTSVTDRLSRQYAFASPTTFLSTDGTWTINFRVDSGYDGYQAMWIFEDLRKSWNFVHNNDIRNGVPYDPGGVKAIWEKDVDCYTFINTILCSSFTYAGPLDSYIFISNGSNNSMDVVAHETAHLFMVNANGHWYVDPNCFTHNINMNTDTACAWSEGWADFLPLAVNGDACYDYLSKPCSGRVDQDYFDLEAHSRVDNPSGNFPWGDAVEGRVAATLYDLYDWSNEGYDRIYAYFGPISKIALANYEIGTFQGFWNMWQYSGEDNFNSGLTFWWNTINYDNIHQVFLPAVTKQ